jgi:hypothetical protein
LLELVVILALILFFGGRLLPQPSYSGVGTSDEPGSEFRLVSQKELEEALHEGKDSTQLQNLHKLKVRIELILRLQAFAYDRRVHQALPRAGEETARPDRYQQANGCLVYNGFGRLV